MAPPNIIFIMTDDERYDWIRGSQLATRPILQSRLISKGTYFRNYRGSFNLCAPSRATIMTGLYWWNHHLFNESAIASFDWTKQWWADAWGEIGLRLFQTCHLGKVVNGWGKTTGALPLPGALTNMLPAFDEFYGFYNEPSKSSGTDAHLTNGSTTITSASIGFTAADEGKVVTSSTAGIGRQAYIHVVDATTATLSTAFTGTTTTSAKITLPGGNEQQKNGFASWEATIDGTDGTTLLSSHQYVSDYTKVDSTTFDAYATDYLRNNALAFLGRVVNRATNDPRYRLPFFLTISPNAGHTPFQDPPVYTPDTTGRTSRLAQFASWIRDIYDTRISGNDQSCTPTAPGLTGTATSTSSTTLTDTSQTWTANQWAGFAVTRGTAFGTVLSNTATTLTIGEWLTVGTSSVATNWSYSLATTPAAGAYTILRADPDIPTTDIGTDPGQHYSTNVTGSGGEYSANPGNNIKDERATGREMVAVDDLVEALCAFLEARTDQYSLDNTVIVYCADNGLIRGEKNVWVDKGFPPDANFRIPLVIRWTGGGIPQGVTNDFHCTTADIYPTIMSLAGIPASVRSRPDADGLDFSEALKGNQSYPTTRAHLFNGNPAGSTRGVITGHYRYYHDSSPPSGFPNDMIFNWVRDPLELRNLWGTAEVTGGGVTIQSDLVAMATTYYGLSAPGVTAGLTY